MQTPNKSILFIGCGKMGGAILQGLLDNGFQSENLFVVDPNESILEPLSKKGVRTSRFIKDFQEMNPDFIFLAVKPFFIPSIIEELKPFTKKGSTIISIIAGRRIEWFKEHLGQNTVIFRAMPNTPAALGKGVTGITTCGKESEEMKQTVHSVFSACGDVLWLKNQEEIDALTAVSGSGPAYVFYFTQTLALAAEKLGFSQEIALELAKKTITGAAYLMQESQESPLTLRENVTTPNGTTAAALEILMNETSGIAPILEKAVKAAEKRSQTLSKA